MTLPKLCLLLKKVLISLSLIDGQCDKLWPMKQKWELMVVSGPS